MLEYVPYVLQLICWLSAILVLMGSVANSTLSRQIEFLEGNEPATFRNTDQDGVYLDRWMVAQYVSATQYLDEQVPLNPTEHNPFFDYPFEPDSAMVQTHRFIVTASVLVFASIIGIMRMSCYIQDGRRIPRIFHGGMIVLLGLTSWTSFMAPIVLARSEILCQGAFPPLSMINNGTFPYSWAVDSFVRVQPHCFFAAGSYVLFAVSFFMILLMAGLVWVALNHDEVVHFYSGVELSEIALVRNDETYSDDSIDSEEQNLELCESPKKLDSSCPSKQ